MSLPISWLNNTWDAQEILSGIYLGSVYAANDLPQLQKRHISCVLDFTGYVHQYPGIQYCSFKNIDDDPNQPMIPLFPTALAFMNYCQENNYNLLVNCHAGISRSSTVIIAYLIHYRNMTVVSSVNYLRSKRSKVSPNHGFLKELEKFVYMDHHLIQDKIDIDCYNFNHNLPVTEYDPAIKHSTN